MSSNSLRTLRFRSTNIEPSIRSILVASIGCLVMLLALPVTAEAQAKSILGRQEKPDSDRASTGAEQVSNDEGVILKHKLKKGEFIRWTIEHLATTETSIQGNQQSSRMKTISTRLWEVTDVDEDGRMTFVQSVEDVQMVNKISDRPEIKYNSREDDTPPPEFSRIPQTIGVPLARFTIDSQALSDDDIQRESNLPPQDLGLGDIVIPLPKGRVKIGQIWTKDGILPATSEQNKPLIIQSRQRYCLTKVENGIAYISVKTQVLTPNITPRIHVQIMQQMTEGMILFDIEKGRVWMQEIDWDEEVIGFDSPDSRMQYNARYKQELGDASRQASTTKGPRDKVASSPDTSSTTIRLRDEKPVIRRK